MALLGALHTWLVLAVVVPFVWFSGTTLLAATPGELERETATFDLLAILFALTWVAVNTFFTAQHLFVERDPGFYANGAVWFIENHDFNFGFELPLNLTAIDSAGFNQGTNGQHLQGSHTFPATLGFIGRFTGLEGMFRATPVFGGLALLAVYSLARQACQAKWAFLSAATLSVVLPFIYFSRDAYTEPMTVMATFTGVSLLATAYRCNANRSMWFLAGAALAAAIALRIDGLLVIAPIVGALAIMKANISWSKLAAFSLPALAGTFVLWYDVSQKSPLYYSSHSRQIHGLLLFGVAAIAVGGVLVIDSRRSRYFVRLLQRLQQTTSDYAIAAGVAAVCILLASRPLWYTQWGPSIDPTLEGSRRLYGEVTVDWLVIYMGPVVVALAAVGFTRITIRLFRGSQLELLPWFVTFVATSTLYLNFPNITPDHIWASRRFLPVIFPSLVIFAGVALDLLEQKFVYTESTPRLTSNFVVAVLAVVVFPAGLSRPFIAVPNHENLASVRQVCAELDQHPDPVVVWYERSSLYLTLPTRTVCKHESATFRLTPSQEVLAEMMDGFDNENRTAIVAVLESELDRVDGWESNRFTAVADIEIVDLEKTYSNRPVKHSLLEIQVMFAQIMPDGTLKPI